MLEHDGPFGQQLGEHGGLQCGRGPYCGSLLAAQWGETGIARGEGELSLLGRREGVVEVQQGT